jgi:hypothetical protein
MQNIIVIIKLATNNNPIITIIQKKASSILSILYLCSLYHSDLHIFLLTLLIKYPPIINNSKINTVKHIDKNIFN